MAELERRKQEVLKRKAEARQQQQQQQQQQLQATGGAPASHPQVRTVLFLMLNKSTRCR
jgi:hypothetical protein